MISTMSNAPKPVEIKQDKHEQINEKKDLLVLKNIHFPRYDVFCLTTSGASITLPIQHCHFSLGSENGVFVYQYRNENNDEMSTVLYLDNSAEHREQNQKIVDKFNTKKASL